MSHYKRRKRSRGGIVGHCGMCMLHRFRCAHRRIPTRQERRALDAAREQMRWTP